MFKSLECLACGRCWNAIHHSKPFCASAWQTAHRYYRLPHVKTEPGNLAIFGIIWTGGWFCSLAEGCFVPAQAAVKGRRSIAALTEQRHSAEAKEPMQRCVNVWNQYKAQPLGDMPICRRSALSVISSPPPRYHDPFLIHKRIMGKAMGNNGEGTAGNTSPQSLRAGSSPSAFSRHIPAYPHRFPAAQQPLPMAGGHTSPLLPYHPAFKT